MPADRAGFLPRPDRGTECSAQNRSSARPQLLFRQRQRAVEILCRQESVPRLCIATAISFRGPDTGRPRSTPVAASGVTICTVDSWLDPGCSRSLPHTTVRIALRRNRWTIAGRGRKSRSSATSAGLRTSKPLRLGQCNACISPTDAGIEHRTLYRFSAVRFVGEDSAARCADRAQAARDRSGSTQIRIALSLTSLCHAGLDARQTTVRVSATRTGPLRAPAGGGLR